MVRKRETVEKVEKVRRTEEEKSGVKRASSVCHLFSHLFHDPLSKERLRHFSRGFQAWLQFPQRGQNGRPV